jgi:hypothetical protein
MLTTAHQWPLSSQMNLLHSLHVFLSWFHTHFSPFSCMPHVHLILDLIIMIKFCSEYRLQRPWLHNSFQHPVVSSLLGTTFLLSPSTVLRDCNILTQV